LRANCRYSRDVVTAVTSPPNFPRPVQLNLHDRPHLFRTEHGIGIGISGDGLHTLELCTPVVVINVRALRRSPAQSAGDWAPAAPSEN
jgi:hypothetical protein